MLKQARRYAVSFFLAVIHSMSIQSSGEVNMQFEVAIEPTEFQLYDLAYIHVVISNAAVLPMRILQIDPACVSVDLVEGDKSGFIARKQERHGGLRFIQVLDKNASWSVQYPLHEFADISKPGVYEVSCKLYVHRSDQVGESRFEEIVASFRSTLTVAPRDSRELQELIDRLTSALSNADKRENAINRLLSINHPAVIQGLTEGWMGASSSEQRRIANSLIWIGNTQALETLESLMVTIESGDIELHVIQQLGLAKEIVRKSPIAARIWHRGLRSGHSDSRWSSIGFIVQYAQQDALTELPKMLNDPIKEVREMADRALRNLTKGGSLDPIEVIPTE